MSKVNKLLFTIAYSSILQVPNAAFPQNSWSTVVSSQLKSAVRRDTKEIRVIKETFEKRLRDAARARRENFSDLPKITKGIESCIDYLRKSLSQPTIKRGNAEHNIASIDYTFSSRDFLNLKGVTEEFNRHSRNYSIAESDLTSFEYDLLRRKVGKLIDEAVDSGVELSESTSKLGLSNNTEIMEAYSVDELAEFFHRIQRNLGYNDQRKFFYTPEVVGVPISIKYLGGVINEAKAEVGLDIELDINALIRSMTSIPQIITNKNTITVKGVFYINIQDFAFLNQVRRNAGLRSWKDSRTAIAKALLYSEEPNKALELRMQCMFHDFYSDEKIRANKLVPSSKIKHLDHWGFPIISEKYRAVSTWHTAIELSHSLSRAPFESSGIKIQLNEVDESTITDHKECKYKNIPTLKTTKVENIDFKVLPNGFVVGEIQVTPIIIEGKSYSRFLINNQTQWEELDIRVNDTILLANAQNMPPYIVKSYQNSSEKPSSFPENCPKCSAKLTAIDTEEGDKAECCSTHLSCVADSEDAMIHFSSACGLNMPSLSNTIITQLIYKDVIANIEDIFLLTNNDFQLLENISKSTFDRLLTEINIAKNTTLPRFIFALNIPSITYIMAEQLALKAGTLNRLQTMTRAEIADCSYMDPAAVDSVVSYFADSNNLKKTQRLLENGVIISEPKAEVMELCYCPISDYAFEKYERLIKKIRENNKRYSLTDFEFDLLNHTADQIEKLHPDWVLTRMDGSLEKETVVWNDPISLKKTYSKEELKHILGASPIKGIVVEPKVNGIACALIYKKGHLIQALTKHEGSKGYDISKMLKLSPHIPQTLSGDFTGLIRGELFILDEDFRQINKDRQRSGLTPYVDALSTLVNSFKKNEQILPVGTTIRFYGYKVVFQNPKAEDNSEVFVLRSDINNYLKDIGFRSIFGGNNKMFYDKNAAIQYATDIESRRLEFPVSIDGMIFKALEISQDTGVDLAFKFDQEVRDSKIKGVIFNVSRNGSISAVAEINPIMFSNGRQVSNVQIQNMEMLTNLSVDDVVTIKYSGGVRPILEEVKRGKRSANSTMISIPMSCPSCQQPLQKQTNGSIICTSMKCIGSNSSNSIYRFAKKVEITNFSNLYGVVGELMRESLVMSKSDFYRLIPEDIYGKTKLSATAIQTLFTNIERSKNCSLEKLLLALGIPKVGPTNVVLIAKAAPSLKALSLCTKDDLLAKGINQSLAKVLVEYFERNKTEIEFLSKVFTVNTNQPRIQSSKSSNINQLKIRTENFISRQASLDDLMRSIKDNLKIIIEANDHDLINLGVYSSSSPQAEESRKVQHRVRNAQRYNRNLLSMLERYSASLNQTSYVQSPTFRQKTQINLNEAKVEPDASSSDDMTSDLNTIDVE